MAIELQNRKIDRQIENLHHQAVIQHKEKKLDTALEFYLESIELDEIQPEWIYGNAIVISAQTNKFDIGTELKERAETLYPNSAEIQRAIGMFSHKSNNINEASKHYLKAIHLDSQQPEWLYIRLVDILVELNYYDRAARVSQQGVEQFPNSETLNRYCQTITPQGDGSSLKDIYTDTEKKVVFGISESRKTPSSIEHCVDLNIDNLRREMMDSAIIDKYQILLSQLLYEVREGVKEMDVDALVHCLAEIKTDIHYLKTKLIDPPAEAVDPQAKQKVDLDNIVSLSRPVPIKCELKERIVGSGWHAPEDHGRWMGPGIMSSIVLPYPTAGKYQLEIVVRGSAKPGLLDTLKIYANDRPIDELQISRGNDFPATVRGEFIAETQAHQSFLAIDLTIEETVNLQEADIRAIGLLIEKICLIPAV
jgi:tetratricopeptide (TPR) repeat protein